MSMKMKVRPKMKTILLQDSYNLEPKPDWLVAAHRPLLAQNTDSVERKKMRRQRWADLRKNHWKCIRCHRVCNVLQSSFRQKAMHFASSDLLLP